MNVNRTMRSGRALSFTLSPAETGAALAMAVRLFDGRATQADLARRDAVLARLNRRMTGTDSLP